MAADRAPEDRARERLTEIVAAVVVVVLLAGLLAAAVAYDRGVDRRRPMYNETLAMAALQTAALAGGSEVEPVDVTGPDSVSVHGTDFSPSDGVRIRVEADGDGYCVIGSTDEGDSTPRYCGDAKHLP